MINRRVGNYVNVRLKIAELESLLRMKTVILENANDWPNPYGISVDETKAVS